MGKLPAVRQAARMKQEPPPDQMARLLAEEILRTIYGDDLHGCPVGLDRIASLINEVMVQRSAQDRDLLTTYERLMEAIDLLSTPPATGNVTNPAELNGLLSERLDAIHAVTTKTLQTTAALRAARSGLSSGT